MENKKSLIPFNITSLLVVLLIGASFGLGALITKVGYLEKQVAGTNNNPGKVAGAQAGDNNPAPAAPQTADNVDPVTSKDHVRGNAKARIQLIEYSDYQCPFCKQVEPTITQVLNTYKDDVSVIYRDFPLISIHPFAQKAAEAAECVASFAGNDGFWKYHDKLFEASPDIAEDKLPQLATDIGLDGNKVKDCLDKDAMKNAVQTGIDSGTKIGIQGTPGIVLLDTKTKKTQLIPGAVPFDQFKTAIDTLLKG